MYVFLYFLSEFVIYLFRSYVFRYFAMSSGMYVCMYLSRYFFL